jgi:hypothetical protein
VQYSGLVLMCALSKLLCNVNELVLCVQWSELILSLLVLWSLFLYNSDAKCNCSDTDVYVKYTCISASPGKSGEV